MNDKFVASQHLLIGELSKKIAALEEENKHLKELLTAHTPDFMPSDEESIARVQIRQLKEESFNRSLSLEEARKLEIYTKIINSITNKEVDVQSQVRNIDDKKLIEIITRDENNVP